MSCVMFSLHKGYVVKCGLHTSLPRISLSTMQRPPFSCVAVRPWPESSVNNRCVPKGEKDPVCELQCLKLARDNYATLLKIKSWNILRLHACFYVSVVIIIASVYHFRLKVLDKSCHKTFKVQDSCMIMVNAFLHAQPLRRIRSNSTLP